MTYFYISGNMGMKSNGSFTRNRSKWITFTESEKDFILNATFRVNKPYGATKQGLFISTDKF